MSGAVLPAFPTLTALREGYAAGRFDPAAVVAEAYRRLEAAQDPGIFLALVPEEQALAAARALDPARREAQPLWGVPCAVKDNIDVAGLPTTAACPGFAYRPTRSATAVERLLAAGAIVIGKTNLDQFATGLVGVRTPYPVPRNAMDAAMVPGGSSSGSAVAVARGIVSVALGTDTAGSGRVPAGLNNIAGLKPSLGMVPGTGMLPACRTLDTISVFAGTVADAATVLSVIAGHDAADPWSRRMPPPGAPVVPPRLRIGVPDAASRRFAGDAQSETAFDASLGDIAALAGEMVPVDLSPFFAVAELLYQGPWVAERYAAIRTVMQERPELLHPVTRRIIAGAERLSAADAFDGLYRLTELRRTAEAVWQHIDVLAVPTYPRPRTVADLAADPIGPNSELGTYTNFVNLLDLCALAVPGRFRADGFPAGVTLIAPAGQDALLTGLGERLHAAAGLTIGATTERVPEPPVRPAEAAPGEVALAVVGAHLSGMALNGELLACGARFLRAAATLPDYRLYALPGGPPKRPGLLRVASGAGTPVAVEVWALPAEGFGRFVAAIPAPLGIGTLRLADGTAAKGFLVEAEGTVGAEDISRFGGWRAYVAGG
ncbi:allophanate hydrolase [Roseomonas sp. OT10]|uniref:allophanate hydrolase n=1 Tax=Roseomonas cutis TaxID=2897332 RepID=UPI001E4F9B84|nr:allophanate hydrolase [Roseomonas sp. OT10]UFN50957.1 allophanate hydrolase [Roseomonas sp. OT10]